MEKRNIEIQINNTCNNDALDVVGGLIEKTFWIVVSFITIVVIMSFFFFFSR